MTTSGTVGQTTFSFGDLLDLAVRRCQQNPAQVLTAELVEAARRAFYLILTSKDNRGLSLWRVEHGFLGLKIGQIQYSLPAGTIRIPNINFVTNTVADGTTSVVVGGYQFVSSDPSTTARVGFMPSADFTGALTLLSSTDGISFDAQSTIASADYVANTWYWFDLPVTEAIYGFQITSATAFTASELAMSSQNYIIPLYQWNRHDYSQQPKRDQGGRPSTNYYFDRQISPVIWLWPNVQVQYDHLEYWIHRLIEDINLLQEEIDVPTQWLNSAAWLLAKELCFIIPKIDPVAKTAVMEEAANILNEAEMGDSDGSSLFLSPNIRGYTR